MAEVRPRLVIHTSSVKDDWAVTVLGPVRLAMAAAKYGSRLVQVSSDAVFSGARVTYDETCLPDPITPYGAVKAAAETGILAVYPEAVVARRSLIVGGGRSVHERAVHELVADTCDGVLFTDDVRCPVHVADLGAWVSNEQAARLPVAGGSVAAALSGPVGAPVGSARWVFGRQGSRRGRGGPAGQSARAAIPAVPA